MRQFLANPTVSSAPIDVGSAVPISQVDPTDILQTAAGVLDVRSPVEFMKGHIPGAHSVPLLHDAARAEVGTLYKQQGREAAIDRGLQLAAPTLEHLVATAKRCAVDGQLLVYCARGGLRSRSVLQLLEKEGLQCQLLASGYKGYRQWVRNTLAVHQQVTLLGGRTGVAKTEVLHVMARKGAQIVDLEGLAGHRGSVFGGLGLPKQPSNQLFENRFFAAGLL